MPETATSAWTIHYETEGDPAKPPIVLFPGLSHRIAHWASLPGRLAGDAHVVMFDPRNIGQSERRDEAYPLEGEMADVDAVLDALGIETAYLFGQALGGMLAQEYAITRPGRVRGLALCATSHRGPDAPAMTADVAEDLKAIKPGMSREEVFGIQNDVLAAPGWPARDPEAYARCTALDLEDPPRRFALDRQREALEGWRADLRLPDLTCPALVITGAHDRMVPPGNAEQIAALIPGAQFLSIAEAGHMPVHETPGLLADAIVGWLRECEGGR